jgi:hypothetical protein
MYAPAPAPLPARPAADRLEMIGFALAVAAAAYLAATAAIGLWLIDAAGRPIANDFVNVHAAGRLALEGRAAAAYDWSVHRAVETALVGHDFEGYYNWPYPPTFLFVAAPLALLPLVPAMLAWLAITLPLYVASIRAIVGHRAGIALACGFPAVMWTITVGQNGFLTAALIGGALLTLERRPVVAGVLLGLLTYKPHFGLLFPIVLVATGNWRAMAAAAVTALLLAAAALAAFGSESWQAFVDSVRITGQAVFAEGRAGIAKQQSLLGLARWLGAGLAPAWTLHGLLAAACAVTLVRLWRGPAAYALRAAALGAGVLLATPYLYIYDFPVLAVPMAFLVRCGLDGGFRRGELAGLAAASALILVFPFVTVPTGLAATLIVAALVLRRAHGCRRRRDPEPGVDADRG